MRNFFKFALISLKDEKNRGEGPVLFNFFRGRSYKDVKTLCLKEEKSTFSTFWPLVKRSE